MTERALDVLKTPGKDDCEPSDYAETPVTTEMRRSSLIVLSVNKQDSPTSESAENDDSGSAESRLKIKRTESALEKVRVSLFGKMENNIETKGINVSVSATSFYGSPIKERCLPLAPDTHTTRNKKPDTKKPNLSLYDLPVRKVAKKRRSSEINSGVGHSIKKFKSKVAYIEKEQPETYEHVKKNCKMSQKENVGEGENSPNDTEYYNPNKKFFKHKRPDECVISVGSKPRQKKNVDQEKPVVSYSNVFGSSKSKKQYFKSLSRRPNKHSISKVHQTTGQLSPDMIKKENLYDPCKTPVNQRLSRQLNSKVQTTGQHSPDMIRKANLHDPCEDPSDTLEEGLYHPCQQYPEYLDDDETSQQDTQKIVPEPDTLEEGLYHPCQQYPEYLDDDQTSQQDIQKIVPEPDTLEEGLYHPCQQYPEYLDEDQSCQQDTQKIIPEPDNLEEGLYHPCQQYSEYLDDDKSSQQDSQQLVPEIRVDIDECLNDSGRYSNKETETEIQVDLGADEALPYINLAMDIENNNFSNNEEMTDVSVHNSEESENQIAAGNTLYFMESLIPVAGSGQNNFEESTSTNSEQFENHDRHILCKKCNFVNKLVNNDEELSKTDKIIIVRPSDKECCKEKGYALLKVANQELGLSEAEMIDCYEKNFFMYFKDNSMIGILVAEPQECAFKLESNSTPSPLRIPETFPVKWGVKGVWVSKHHRRQGIATKMMDTFRYHLKGNCQVSLNELAFSIPTTSGRLFAEKYMGTHDLKVY